MAHGARGAEISAARHKNKLYAFSGGMTGMWAAVMGKGYERVHTAEFDAWRCAPSGGSPPGEHFGLENEASKLGPKGIGHLVRGGQASYDFSWNIKRKR